MSASESTPRPRSSAALVVLVSGLACGLLYFAHAAFIPIALALLFALLLSSPVEALHRKGIPRGLSAVVILVIILSAVGVAVALLRAPAQEWLAAAPRTASIIQRKIGPAARLMQRIDVVTSRAGHLTDSSTNGAAPPKPPVVATASTDSDTVLTETRTAMVSAVTVVILTLFLLAAGAPVLARMSASFASNTHAAQVLLVMRAVRREVGRYYATIAIINFGLGLATFGAMWALGMPNPV
ncbi:MAG: AI-2E family transporter, partial [Terriglobales bacterium]